MAKTAAVHRHAAHSAHHRVSQVAWFDKYKTVLEWVGASLALLALLSSAAQLLYPANQALPWARIGGIDVGGKDRAAIEAQLNEYAQKGEVTIATPHKQWKALWQSIGVNVDSKASAEVVLNYAWWERLIPFSGVIKVAQSQDMPLVGLVDPERLDAFAKKIITEERRAAVDASLSIVDGKVVIDKAQNGYRYTESEVKRQIQAVAVTDRSTLNLAPEVVPYVRSTDQIQAIKNRAEAILAHNITLSVAGKTYKPGAKTVGGWLKLSEDTKTKELDLTIDRDKIKQYLLQINSDIAIDPGTITVTLLDGREIDRTSAPQGRSVAVSSSIDRIVSALNGADTQATVELAVADVPPRINYVHTYSNGNAGLLAIIKDWNASHYGDFGVVVRELGGQGRFATWQADKPFVTASTFKLFVYYAVAKKIQAGQLSYSTKTDMGWTVVDCLEEIIVRSTNPCAISLLNLIGWQTAQNMVSAAGFGSTFINNQNGGDKYSTPRDESNYLLRLHGGSLMAPEPTNRLLGYMKQQIWRAGIPSGVPAGTVVADKVGFYNGWVHDVAIVYGPHRTFILAIMSKGGSDPAFANLASRIHDFFN